MLSSKERKAAAKEFTKRGHLLTTLAEKVTSYNATHQPVAAGSYGPTFSAQVGPFYTRGYLESLDRDGLVLLDLIEGAEMPCFVRFGQLTTDSLSRLIALLS